MIATAISASELRPGDMVLDADLQWRRVEVVVRDDTYGHADYVEVYFDPDLVETPTYGLPAGDVSVRVGDLVVVMRE